MSWQTIETWHVVGVGPMIIQQNGPETRHSINGSPWEHHNPEANPEPVEVILEDVPEPIEAMDVLPLHFNPKRKKPHRKIPDDHEHLDRKLIRTVLHHLALHPHLDAQDITATLGIPEPTSRDMMAYLSYHGYVLRRWNGKQYVFEVIHATQFV